MKNISRKKATYFNLSFQYLMMGLMIVRGIIIPPLAAFHIDHDLLGAWFASGNIIQWLMISEGGAWLYLRQQAALESGKKVGGDLSYVVGSGSVFLIVLALIITFVGHAIAGSVPGWMNVDEVYSSDLILAFTLTATGMGLGIIASIPRAISHGLQRQILINVNQLVAEAVSVAVIIWMIIDGYGIIALGIGPLIRESIHNLLNWPTYFSIMKSIGVKPSFSLSYLIGMSGNMGWTFLNNLGLILRKNVDAIIVSQVFGNSSVLIVEWTKRSWDIFSTLITRASASFTPALSHLYGEGDITKFRKISGVLFSTLSVGLGLVFAFGVSFNSQFMGLWLGENFYGGDVYNVFLGLATVVSAITFSQVEVLYSRGSIKGPAIVQLLSSIFRLIILFSLIPLLGIVSVPVSLFITELLIGFCYMSYLWVSVLEVPVNEMLYKIAMFAKLLIIGALVAMAWNLYSSIDSWLVLIVNGIIFGGVIIVVYYSLDKFVRDKSNDFFSYLIQRSH